MHATSSEKSRENDINLGSNEDWENVKFEKPVGTKLIFPRELTRNNGRLDISHHSEAFFPFYFVVFRGLKTWKREKMAL